MDPDDTQNPSKTGTTVGVGKSTMSQDPLSKPAGMGGLTGDEPSQSSGLTPTSEEPEETVAYGESSSAPVSQPSSGVSSVGGGLTEPSTSIPEPSASAPPAPPDEVGTTPLSSMPSPTPTQDDTGLPGNEEVTSSTPTSSLGTDESAQAEEPQAGVGPVSSSKLPPDDDEGETPGGLGR